MIRTSESEHQTPRKVHVSIVIYPPQSPFHGLEGITVDDWLIKQVTFLGIPFQNWMVVTFALILIAMLINQGEKN